MTHGLGGIVSDRAPLSKEAQEQIDKALASGGLSAFEAVAGLLKKWGRVLPDEGERALAEETLAAIRDRMASRPSCAEVALLVVGPFHVIMAECQAGEIGRHYRDEVSGLLEVPPSNQNLRRLADRETAFWQTDRGSWLGRRISADLRYNLLVEARDRHLSDWESRLATASASVTEPSSNDQSSNEPSTDEPSSNEPEGATMKQGGGDDSAGGGGKMEAVGQAIAVAKEVPAIVVAVFDAYSHVRQGVKGSYQIEGADLGDEFGTLPDEDGLDLALPARKVNYSIVTTSTLHLGGTFSDGARNIGLDNNVTVMLSLNFAYEWGLKRDVGPYPCLHVRSFRLTSVKMSHPSFTDVVATYTVKPISPKRDYPVAGIRLALTVDLDPGNRLGVASGRHGGTMDFYGDGSIVGDLDGCPTRAAALTIDDSPDDADRRLLERAEAEHEQAEQERAARELAAKEQLARDEAANEELSERIRERAFQAGDQFS